MRCHRSVAVAVALVPAAAFAGMPAALPEDFALVFRLNQSAHERLQAISFFLFGVAASALAVQFLWNYLKRDFDRLPQLTYPRALSVVVLWGLLFVIVLTMISGARELMTPGAWQKAGWTYRLAQQPKSPAEPHFRELRRQRLEALRLALLKHAAMHSGRYPEQTSDIGESWAIPAHPGF